MNHFPSSVATHALSAARWVGCAVQWGVYMVDWFGEEQLTQYVHNRQCLTPMNSVDTCAI